MFKAVEINETNSNAAYKKTPRISYQFFYLIHFTLEFFSPTNTRTCALCHIITMKQNITTCVVFYPHIIKIHKQTTQGYMAKRKIYVYCFR